MKINRREFLQKSGIAVTGLAMASPFSNSNVVLAQGKRGPHKYVIVEGHHDIWEFNDRFALNDPAQNSPLRDFLLPRLLDGGVDVVIMPAGGVEAETMNQHWSNFIKLLGERGYTEDDIALILGGNYLRIWEDILPEV